MHRQILTSTCRPSLLDECAPANKGSLTRFMMQMWYVNNHSQAMEMQKSSPLRSFRFDENTVKFSESMAKIAGWLVYGPKYKEQGLRLVSTSDKAKTSRKSFFHKPHRRRPPVGLNGQGDLSKAVNMHSVSFSSDCVTWLRVSDLSSSSVCCWGPWTLSVELAVRQPCMRSLSPNSHRTQAVSWWVQNGH